MPFRFPSALLMTLAVFGVPWWLVLTQALLVLVSFTIGLTIGWTLADGTSIVTRPRIQKAIAIVVTSIWSVSVIADIVLPGYATPILLYAIMGAVAGYFFSEDGFTITLGEDR